MLAHLLSERDGYDDDQDVLPVSSRCANALADAGIAAGRCGTAAPRAAAARGDPAARYWQAGDSRCGAGRLGRAGTGQAGRRAGVRAGAPLLGGKFMQPDGAA